MDAQYMFGHPGMGFLTMLIIGGLAGWIAGKVAESRHGLLTNILIGICGAFVGGKLAEVLQIPVHGFLEVLIAAIVGAIIVLYGWRMLRRS
jgi:uncharacterized membrane protein YeaQ/YmgE (transglycosylase-associated protein family)